MGIKYYLFYLYLQYFKNQNSSQEGAGWWSVLKTKFVIYSTFSFKQFIYN